MEREQFEAHPEEFSEDRCMMIKVTDLLLQSIFVCNG